MRESNLENIIPPPTSLQSYSILTTVRKCGGPVQLRTVAQLEPIMVTAYEFC